MAKQPAIPTPAEQPAPPPMKSTDLLVAFHRMISSASADELRFLSAFVRNHQEGQFNVIETAFAKSAAELGYGGLSSEADNEYQHKEEINALMMLTIDHPNEWLYEFVTSLLSAYLNRLQSQDQPKAWAPRDVLFAWENEADRFNMALDEARVMLKRYPEMFGGSNAR